MQAEPAAEAREAGRQRVAGAGAGIGPRRRVAHPSVKEEELVRTNRTARRSGWGPASGVGVRGETTRQTGRC